MGLLVLDDAPDRFIPGETLVTHHVVDSFGNAATCVQKVVVVDDEALLLTCSESETVDAAADACEWSGIMSAVATDNCAEELTVDVEDSYPVGQSPIVFTAADAAGNSAECTTLLTVRDVTAPVVVCGTVVGTLPTVIRASASDACSAVVTLENVSCVRVVDAVRTPLTLAQCPISITGDTMEVTGGLTEGVLEIAYDARAVDPSSNFAVVPCVTTYDPDRDADGIIDAEDNCVVTANGAQSDGDADGIGDLCDVCPALSDPDQADVDADGVGDACSDKDEDSVLDAVDNCELTANREQLDVDGDELGDACDPAPYEGLTAEGSGGCSGGGGGLLAGLIGLVGLFAIVRTGRRRGASRG